MKVKIYFSLLVTFLLNISLFAQDGYELSGKVSDGTDPVPGVNVLIKGSSNGTSTNFDGLY